MPFVIATEEGLPHPIQDLSGMTLKRTLAEQDSKAIVGWVNPNFDWPSIAAVEHFVHYRHLVGMSPVQGAAQ
jgi:hypothetical protein